MSRKTFKIILILLGLIVLGVCAAGDYLYPPYYPGIHSAQIFGMVIGALMLLTGIFLPAKTA